MEVTCLVPEIDARTVAIQVVTLQGLISSGADPVSLSESGSQEQSISEHNAELPFL